MQLLEQLHSLSIVDQVFFVKHGFGDAIAAPFQCVHHAFAACASSRPDSIAVEDFAERITYDDLDKQSNYLAVQLQSLGIQRYSRVCLLIERSISMVVAILAILKAGAVYVPLDGNVASKTTIQHVLQDSKASAILTFRKFRDRIVNEVKIPIVFLDDSPGKYTESSLDERCLGGDLSMADDSVYVIYTSGKATINVVLL